MTDESQVPEGLLYSTEHEWLLIEAGEATVGITDYAQDSLGDVVYVDMPRTGTVVAFMQKLGEIESVKAVSDLYSPVSGEVVEANQEAVNSPELVNQQPYGRGWLIKVRMSDASELDKLLSAEAYEELVMRTMEEETD